MRRFNIPDQQHNIVSIVNKWINRSVSLFCDSSLICIVIFKVSPYLLKV